MKKYLTQRYKWRIILDFLQIEPKVEKDGGVITYIKATEAVDAEQLIAKYNSYVEYQLIHMKKRNIALLMCSVLQTAQQNNLEGLEWIKNKTNRNRKSNAKYHIYWRPELSNNYRLANGNSRRWNTSKSGSSKCLFAICTRTMLTAIYTGANQKK